MCAQWGPWCPLVSPGVPWCPLVSPGVHLVPHDVSGGVAGAGANIPDTGLESTGSQPRCNVSLYTCTVLYSTMPYCTLKMSSLWPIPHVSCSTPRWRARHKADTNMQRYLRSDSTNIQTCSTQSEKHVTFNCLLASLCNFVLLNLHNHQMMLDLWSNVQEGSVTTNLILWWMYFLPTFCILTIHEILWESLHLVQNFSNKHRIFRKVVKKL